MSPQITSTEARKLLDNFTLVHGRQAQRVWKMESITEVIDVGRILSLNDRLRTYYNEHPDLEMTALLDRMTAIMNDLTAIIDLVKNKRKDLELAKREINEKIGEIEEVVSLMKSWQGESKK